MSVSIVIPTCNRADVLSRALKAYVLQSGNHEMIEIIVVDDGSTDNTQSVVEECGKALPVPVRYFRQQNKGAAAARNCGILHAQGDVILFADDDVIPTPSMVSEHSTWHHQHPDASTGMLGYVPWAQEVHPTPFMLWSGLYGPQFRYGVLTPGAEIPFDEAYTCNLSLKTSFIRASGLFDESITGCGWEDVEFAYRLYQKGCRIFFNPEAIGFHYKFETFDDTLRRIEQRNARWPLVARTEAGRYFLELWQRQRMASKRSWAKAVKNFARPLVAPLARRLVDTRIPLPGRIYGMVLWHYGTPLSDRVLGRDGSGAATSESRQLSR